MPKVKEQIEENKLADDVRMLEEWERYVEKCIEGKNSRQTCGQVYR